MRCSRRDSHVVRSWSFPFIPAKRMKPVAGFNDDYVDYDAALSGPVAKRKRELIRLDDSNNVPPQGDAIAQLINSIPTDKEELMMYPINYWAIVEQHQIIDKRIKPWVAKNILEKRKIL
ncbi:hypothetical protein Pelo_18112 [Pelomyxa schiedti]|nr:hypothetical protein Pelo_18112 [Pelomyxa schiedti]